MLLARIARADGRRWVSCPGCGQKLGEIVGDRLIVKAGHALALAITVRNDQEATCPRCFAVSVLRAEDVA
jgi:uncharacterized C2H2 Zn-finger protein